MGTVDESVRTGEPTLGELETRLGAGTTGPLGLRRPKWWALALLVVWGPGLIVMLADTDAGSFITAGQSGAQWGYAMVPSCSSRSSTWPRR
jgi:hypothetical protein